MRIGELADAAGTTAKTLRFYEDQGLLPPAGRTPSGYRNYTLRLPGRLKRSAAEHFEITEAICAGNALEAQRLMTIHADVKRSDFAPFIALIDARPVPSSNE